VDDLEPEELLNDYIEHAQAIKGIKVITINTYLRHIVPVLKYGVPKKDLPQFRMKHQ
jgi:hypothetical protein